MTDKTKAQRKEIRELRSLLEQARDLIESADVCDEAWETLAQCWADHCREKVSAKNAIEVLGRLRDLMTLYKGDSEKLGDVQSWLLEHAGHQEGGTIFDQLYRLLAAAPADKPAETAPCGPPAEMSARAEFGDDKQCVVCGYFMGPHICTKCGWIPPKQPDAGTTADERERLAARCLWEQAATCMPAPPPGGGTHVHGYWIPASVVTDALDLMRTAPAPAPAPDSDATRRAERAEAEVERLTKQIATMDSARLVEQGLAVSAEKRVTHLEGEVERLTKERDGGWAALERLREWLHVNCIQGPLTRFIPLHSAHEQIERLLASRPAQGKEAGRG